MALSLNNSTKEIINKNVLKKANKKIIIINASRGAIINERHLLEFLKKIKVHQLCWIVSQKNHTMEYYYNKKMFSQLHTSLLLLKRLG